MDIEPIGWVSSPRDDAIDDDWGAVVSTIALDPARFAPEALAGLDGFSHLEVVFVFDRVDDGQIHHGARHPRGNPEWPEIGIFAQRAKNRPNRIGVTVCRLVSVDGLKVQVEGLDAIDGTPIVDLKPYMAEFGPRGAVVQPAWSRELMAGYWADPDSGSPTSGRR